jgi:hypothetical protein
LAALEYQANKAKSTAALKLQSSCKSPLERIEPALGFPEIIALMGGCPMRSLK